MTDKQKRFVAEYIKDFDSKRAAIRAGYAKKTASYKGLELLKNPKILDEIGKELRKQEKNKNLIREKIVSELAKIAFSNYSDFVKITKEEEYKEIWDEEEQAYIKVLCPVRVAEPVLTDDLSPDRQSAIRSIKTDRYGVKIETYDKVKALELLGKHLSMFKDSFDPAKDEEEEKTLVDLIGEAYKKRLENQEREGEKSC